MPVLPAETYGTHGSYATISNVDTIVHTSFDQKPSMIPELLTDKTTNMKDKATKVKFTMAFDEPSTKQLSKVDSLA